MVSEDDLKKPYFRPSATIIIAAKSAICEQGYDYRILLAMRTEATAYAPNHHVFPGGVFDAKADESQEWLDHFQQFGITATHLSKLCLEHMPNRPRPLMTDKKHLSRDISLRITAIREAFEEVGLLLCLTREQLNETVINQHSLNGCGTFYDNFDRSYWQERVHNNSRDFLELCKYLKVVPDIWSLHEWSIWRSPPTAIKKYDTVIYFVALNEQPKLILEPSEVERELWTTPSQSLKLYKDRSIWLAPMQIYELCRLSNIQIFDKLKEFTKERSPKGSTLLMLAYYRCDDFLVGTLPNDDCYPENPENHTGTIQIPGTASDFSAKTKNCHRLIYWDVYDISVECNIPAIDHHLSPIPRTVDVEISKL